MNQWLQVRGLRDSAVLGSQTCRRYSIWKTLAGFRTTRGTTAGEYPTRHLDGLSICVHSEACQKIPWHSPMLKTPLKLRRQTGRYLRMRQTLIAELNRALRRRDKRFIHFAPDVAIASAPLRCFGAARKHQSCEKGIAITRLLATRGLVAKSGLAACGTSPFRHRRASDLSTPATELRIVSTTTSSPRDEFIMRS